MPRRSRRDLATNYADDLTVISKDGVYHGKDGIVQTAEVLERNLPDARFSYDMLRVP